MSIEVCVLAQRSTPVSFVLDSEGHGCRILETLAGRFATRAEGRPPYRETLLDTFDGRLFRRGLSLSVVAVGRGWRLSLTGRDGSPLRRVLVDSIPAFAEDLPPGPLRAPVAGAIEMRRLLPLVEAERREQWLSVVDPAEKTVARVALDHGRVARADGSDPRPIPPRLRVLPVTGYDEAFGELVGFLGQSGLDADDAARVGHTFRAAGLDPTAYSSKIRVDLDPEMRSDEAVREILRSLLRTIRANEDGTRRDLDSEFLHDLRVAVRRTRSCVGQVKRVFPEEPLRRFRREFEWLGKVTGPTRDLDVHILAIVEYLAELAPETAAALAPLSDFLRRSQKEAQKKLARALESRRYRDLIAGWQAFLDDPAQPAEEPANASRPILAVASQRIRRGYERMQRTRDRWDGISDEPLHRLRIEGKKLRYLLEFFRSLYAADALRVPLSTLKRLQDNLGSINDFRVQQQTLRQSAERMLEERACGSETVLAMGRLSERLARKREQELTRFAELFAAFTAVPCRRAVEHMVEPSRSERR